MLNQVDALIIGAGPSGSTAAYSLAKAGWAVAIVEKSTFPRRKVCGEYLSPTNLPLFRRLGFEDKFLQLSGPVVKRVGLFAKSAQFHAPMPCFGDSFDTWGRAIRREILDTVLLAETSKLGADVWQPWSVSDISKRGGYFVSRLKKKGTTDITEIQSKIVISAHGSWELGNLPTQTKRQPLKPTDLIGMKAHFEGTLLEPDLMPMIIFPGGYGGMVTCDDGIVSISCCIRNDYLQQVRNENSSLSIGDAIQKHIFGTCNGVFESLSGARRVGEWLTAGTIRPGIRRRIVDDIFLVGNAAGESHPIIAEGISMGIQSSWLLTQCLLSRGQADASSDALKQIGNEYNKVWLQTFRNRIHVASLFARLAMSDSSQKYLSPLFRAFPSLLTFGARLGGKVHRVA